MGELACLIAPRKLIVCIGELDPIYPLVGTKEVCQTIEKIYKKENAIDNFALVVIPDKPHYFDKVATFNKLMEMRK